MSVPARQAREALGARLREIRTGAGLTGLGLADLAGWHSSKVSKIEHGKQNPTENDIRAWCRHCTADDHIDDLVAAMRSIETMYVELRRLHRAGTAERQRKILEEERETKLLRGFQMFLVPDSFRPPSTRTRGSPRAPTSSACVMTSNRPCRLVWNGSSSSIGGTTGSTSWSAKSR